MVSIIGQIITGGITLWNDVEQAIDNDWAKFKAAMPSSAVPDLDKTVSDLKQDASDVLGAVNTGLTGAEPDLVTAVETALDAWLAAATNGATVAINPLINKGLTDGANLVTSAASAWLLRTQASLSPPLPPKPVAAASIAGVATSLGQ